MASRPRALCSPARPSGSAPHSPRRATSYAAWVGHSSRRPGAVDRCLPRVPRLGRAPLALVVMRPTAPRQASSCVCLGWAEARPRFLQPRTRIAPSCASPRWIPVSTAPVGPSSPRASIILSQLGHGTERPVSQSPNVAAMPARLGAVLTGMAASAGHYTGAADIHVPGTTARPYFGVGRHSYFLCYVGPATFQQH